LNIKMGTYIKIIVWKKENREIYTVM